MENGYYTHSLISVTIRLLSNYIMFNNPTCFPGNTVYCRSDGGQATIIVFGTRSHRGTDSPRTSELLIYVCLFWPS